MTMPTLWWLLAGGLVLAELFSGTFYLLMLALGAAAGALTAYLDVSPTWQLVAAAAVGGAAVVLWHWQHRPANPARDQSLHLDIGETVTVPAWDSPEQTQVKYRGAAWTAIRAPHSPLEPGLHRIVEVQGNRLVLVKI